MRITRTFFFFLLFSTLISSNLLGVPARPTPVTITQPNGEPVTFKIIGDENFNYTTTLDGYVIREDETGNFRYAALGVGNHITLTPFYVKEINKRTKKEREFLQNINSVEVVKALQEEHIYSSPMKAASQITHKKNNFPVEGQVKSIVILVEFKDKSFKIDNLQQAFHEMLNKEGYNHNGAKGSARDYFVDNSGEHFLPEFDVYGPVKVSQTSAYYAYSNYVAREMVVEACRILSEEQGVDFSQYDMDKDGVVDNVYLFYAGYGRADGGSATTLWPHTWNVDEYELMLNGVQVSTYACSNELAGGAGETMASIGNFIHEFCHVLGLPDLYVTGSSTVSEFTPREYSVLDYGCYNNNQKTPCNLTAYERYCLGWLNPEELKTAANVGLKGLEENAGYMITTPYENEFYILENRQQTGWDEYLPGHGMLVWHIDYVESIWDDKIINNDEHHQYVDLVEADNMATSGTRDGDPFPGSQQVTSFTDDTTPNMRTWNSTALNKPITEIAEKEGYIFFRFMGGGDNLTGKVQAVSASEIVQAGFVANWKELTGAFGYYLTVYYVDENSTKTVVYGYEDKFVADRTYCKVVDIEPGREYRYIVKATDGFSVTASSDEIVVETLAPTFEYFIPEAKSATQVTENSFVANWEMLEEADNYLLNVYQKTFAAEIELIAVDFTGKLTALPEGWTATGSTLTPEGYYGESSPALRFDTHTQYLQTSVYEDGLSSLSFWYRAENASNENALQIKGYNGRTWEVISIIQPLVNEEPGTTVEFHPDDLEGYYALAFYYQKSGSGNVYIDDIVLGHGGEPEYAEIENRQVGSITSYPLEGLEADQYYYYTVTGVKGELLSRPSKEIRVFTNPLTSIQQQTFSALSYFEGGILIKTNENSVQHVGIYTLCGNKVHSSTFYDHLELYTDQFAAGIYILKVNQDTYKIVIK